MAVLGALGIALAALIGLRVQQSITPRIRRLVAKIRHFQDFGTAERDLDRGEDEIAVLANALDAGFAAISARDRDRERFLAIAAHELKTPVTSILGFAQASLKFPNNEHLRLRGLEVIARRAERLARLIEDLLWAARSRAHDLPFDPRPLDIAQLLARVLSEMELMPIQSVRVRGPAEARILGDETLLSHALWTLLSFGTAISPPDQGLELELAQRGPSFVLEVTTGGFLADEEVERAFTPFEIIQYEGPGPRVAVGLYLAREIARLHGGSLRKSTAHGATVFTLVLPA
jgi:signal transduction histidine kinase